MKPLFWSAGLLFMIVVPISIGHTEEPEEEPRLPLAMEVFLKKPKAHQYEIHIHLTNISNDPLTVDVHDLPWTPPNDSQWLLAYRLDGEQTPIEQRNFLGNFGSRRIRLVPGESVQDKLELTHRIPSLLEDIRDYGVQLQWDCPPPSLRFVCKAGASHTITIPKGDPGNPDVYIIDAKACRRLEQAIGLVTVPQHHDVLFLLTTAPVLSDLKSVQTLLYRVDNYVQQCKPTWTNSWSVSFFTEERYVGFVTDLENQDYFERGLWQQANIGQYSSQIRTLFRFPWIRKKSDSVYLSVYR